jgi:hypothetical protein
MTSDSVRTSRLSRGLPILWSISIAISSAAVAWLNRSDPLIVFAAGYVCSVHAEHVWDILRGATWRKFSFKKVRDETGIHNDKG